MNLPSGVQFRTVAQMIIDKMKLWDACRPHIDRASDLGYEVAQKRESPDPCLCTARDIEARAKCIVPDSSSGYSIRQSTALLCTDENVAALVVPCCRLPETEPAGTVMATK